MANVTPQSILVDPGIAPLISHLGKSSGYRLWCIARDIDTTGAGIVAINDLYAALPLYGVTTKKDQLDNIITSGHQTFWHIRGATIRYCGYARLWAKLSRRVSADIAHDCRPQPRVYVSAAGTIGRFNANLYASWIETRNTRGAITMSRELLMRIWNVTTMTLRTWEELAGVSRIENRAQYGGADPNVPPAHAYAYARKDGTVGAAWQLPNTYTNSQTFRHHPKAGQKRKAQKARARVLDLQKGAQQCGAAQATGRLYFEGKTPYATAKTVRRHLIKHGDAERHHYVRLGEMVRRRGVVVMHECYDAKTDILHTEMEDRVAKVDSEYQSIVQLALTVGSTGVGLRWKKTIPTLCVSIPQNDKPRPAKPSAISQTVRAHHLRNTLNRMQQVKRGRKHSFKAIALMLELLDAGYIEQVENLICAI